MNALRIATALMIVIGTNFAHAQPSREEMEKMKACAEAKGVTLPPPPEPGERPQLDETTRTALDACHEELGIPKPQHGVSKRNNASSN